MILAAKLNYLHYTLTKLAAQQLNSFEINPADSEITFYELVCRLIFVAI
jgi:hypothetical protein